MTGKAGTNGVHCCMFFKRLRQRELCLEICQVINYVIYVEIIYNANRIVSLMEQITTSYEPSFERIARRMSHKHTWLCGAPRVVVELVNKVLTIINI